MVVKLKYVFLNKTYTSVFKFWYVKNRLNIDIYILAEGYFHPSQLNG